MRFDELRSDAFARRCAETLAGADHCHSSSVAAAGSIFGARANDFNFVAELHRCASPTTALKAMGRSHLEAPVLHLAVLVLDIDVEPHMGIGPFDLGHVSLYGNRFVRVKLRCKRMVS